MKLRLFVFIGVVAALAMVASDGASAAMKLGAGYFRPEAPVGGRLWFNDAVAGDLGIGFSTEKRTNPETDAQKTKLSFQLDLGLPIVLMGKTDKTKFFFRPGFAYASAPGAFEDKDWVKEKTVAISGSLGVEHFIAEHFSVQVAHGIRFQSFDPGTKGSKKDNRIMTEAMGVSDIGFHYYFWTPE
jgi:hypothetical protein